MSVLIGLNGPSITYDQKPNNRLHTERLYHVPNLNQVLGVHRRPVKRGVRGTPSGAR